MNKLSIELHIPKNKAEVCQKALGLEAKNESFQRSEIKFEEFSNGLRILVSAKDLSAMRAAVNTYLRWVIMCCSLIDN